MNWTKPEPKTRQMVHLIVADSASVLAAKYQQWLVDNTNIEVVATSGFGMFVLLVTYKLL